MLPVGPITGDEAGELPGVSMTLLVADRSMDTIVEIESRSCWFLFVVKSSNAKSMFFISVSIALHLARVSCCNLIISPLTVSLSLTPFSMIANTLSMAGP